MDRVAWQTIVQSDTTEATECAHTHTHTHTHTQKQANRVEIFDRALSLKEFFIYLGRENIPTEEFENFLCICNISEFIVN